MNAHARGYPPAPIDARITTRVALSDEAWAALAPLIPPPPKPRHNSGRRPLDDRAVLAGILTVLVNRIGFEALPVEFGHGSGMTCYRRLRHWHHTGAWPAIARGLREVLPPGAHIDLARVDQLFRGGAPRPRRTPAHAGAAPAASPAATARGGAA